MMLSKFRMLLMGVSLEEIRFQKHGFPLSTPQKTSYLENIAETFLTGYHQVIQTASQSAAASTLEATVAAAVRGFAYEGAAMGFAILDLVTPWKHDRLEQFIRQEAAPHHYMTIVGAGWAYARLNRKLNTPLAHLDPIFGWLVMDGYGFHVGFFDWKSTYQRQIVPPHLSDYACRVFDQGIGRALWFVGGADIQQIEKMICNFPQERQGDLWSGIGLAATYAGGVTNEEIRLLQRAAGEYSGNLGQGSVFAAAARHRAGNTVAHNEMACELLTGLTIPEAAQLVDTVVQNHGAQPSALPPYEVVRRKIIAELERNYP